MRTITSTGERKKTSWILNIGSQPKLKTDGVIETSMDHERRILFQQWSIPTTETLIFRFKQQFPNHLCENGYDVYGAAAFDEQVVELISNWFVELVTVLTAIQRTKGIHHVHIKGGVAKRTDFLPTIRRTCRALESTLDIT
ncbi:MULTISPECIES: hypothetical protein [unclassified Exiguobacterium]|uniref:hypothetical protein n=1 Tax=unclassified Exiguobacterium TaxID=2644629 RepID=UPI000B58997E|nr:MULTISPECIES: hypothetical protein [unclassified Exiguobacterium]ASI35178.1 hypothetical protein A0126_06210 [Exiguobacterium sp. N4-1P]ASI37191.1 hypothetical protein A0126_16485 [Exiguobacterium sp. N4-1P]